MNPLFLDIAYEVFSYLDGKDLISCERVCNDWKTISDSKNYKIRKREAFFNEFGSFFSSKGKIQDLFLDVSGGWDKFRKLPSLGQAKLNFKTQASCLKFAIIDDVKFPLMRGIDSKGVPYIAALVNETVHYKSIPPSNKDRLLILFPNDQHLKCTHEGQLPVFGEPALSPYQIIVIKDLFDGKLIKTNTNIVEYDCPVHAILSKKDCFNGPTEGKVLSDRFR